MARELLIYCDESDIKGKHFSNFYGGALVESTHLAEVSERLHAKKVEQNLGAELKWQKISENYAEKYMAFVDEVFALVSEGKLKLRIMFTQNYFRAVGLTQEHRENGFFLLYYQFVKHAFGLRYAGTAQSPTRVRMYFDMLPDKKEKCEAFKGYVLGLNKSKEFRSAGIHLSKDQIAEVDSKEHVILQSLDVVMGAMQFRLNDKHKEIPEGSRVRGKRTVAKERVYKHILACIKRHYPGYAFNPGISTGIWGDYTNRWHQGYSHWLFKPENHEAAKEFAKK